MEQSKQFEFFAPMSSFTKGKEHDGTKVIDVLVGGVISDESIDEDGERLIQDGIDFSYFKSNGVLKYEHSKGASAIIGHPIELIRKGKRTEFTGHILAKAGTPQFQTAQEVVGLMENAALWNQVHPENPKPVGFSVEGNYGKVLNAGSHKDVQKSKVVNLVFTANPKNKNTFAIMYKSFMAGDSVNVGDLTGSQAGRTQHLDGATKKSKIIGVNKMKFKDKAECEQFYISKGFSKEEASEEASEWEKKMKARKDTDDKHTEKIGKIQKSIEKATEMLKSFDVTGEVETMNESFTKSMKTDDNNEINPVTFLKSIGGNTIQFFKSISAQNKGMMETMVEIFDTLKESLEMNKSLTNEVRELEDQNTDLIKFNDELTKNLQKLDKSIKVEPVADPNADPNKDPNADPNKDKPKYSPAEVSAILEKSIKTSKNEGEDNVGNLTTLMMKAESRGFNYNLLNDGDKATIDGLMVMNK